MHALILFDPSMRCLFFCGAVTPTLSYVPVTVATYWYDNHGPATLQHSQDLMRLQRFVGSLTLGISALIAAITSIISGSNIIESMGNTAIMLILCQKMFL